MDIAGHLARSGREDGSLALRVVQDILPVLVGILVHGLEMYCDVVHYLQAPVLAGPKDKPLFACTQMKTAKLLSSEAYEDGTVVMRYEMVREN